MRISVAHSGGSMRTFRIVSVLSLLLVVGACASLARTQGDPQDANAFGYQPLDPFEVKVTTSATDRAKFKEALLDRGLPDVTMRMAVGALEASAGVTYGPATLSVAGKTYRIVIDYGHSTTASLPLSKAVAQSSPGETNKKQSTFTKLVSSVTVKDGRTDLSSTPSGDSSTVIVPVYIGVGLRLTATLQTFESGINLGSLIAIGAKADAKALSGTLVIQALGITGENIATTLPISSEISAASIQQAILALGTMKSKLYDAKTSVTPRVIGFYNSVGGGSETVNNLISSLLTTGMKMEVN